MARFNVTVDHHSARENVIQRLQGFSEQMRKEMPSEVTDVTESWDDSGNLTFAFKAMGFQVSGKMETCDRQVRVDGKIPFAALPFRGAIESQIAEKIREIIREA